MHVPDIQEIFAFCDGESGGNAAGVVIGESLPAESLMQDIAARLCYSETVFAAPVDDGWRVRYFAPAMEVPFCGHATIALGAALAERCGNGVYTLALNDAVVTVEGRIDNGSIGATLTSPRPDSEAADPELIDAALLLFGYTRADLDPRISPAIISAGARHLLLALRSRAALRAMSYDLAAGRAFMLDAGIITVVLVFSESAQLFHARNPFASGGVYEDPATGAAAAALGGYLRQIGWPYGGGIDILQGEDMGSPSRLHAEIPAAPGTGIRVSGRARITNRSRVLP